MLNLTEIEKFYPQNLSAFKKSMLREYLQYRILEIIFRSDYAKQLSFLGGTALRIVYGSSRFSEDIDFDNFNLTVSDFEKISEFIKKSLESDGYTIEIRNVQKAAYHCYIKFPRLLFDNNISGLEEEKILIQLDTMAHDFKYEPVIFTLDKFDVFGDIFVTPKDILLSQKIFAAVSRKNPKGRDFFDIIYLLRDTKPNYDYLKEKMGINSSKKLKENILEFCKKIDFDKLASDVKYFLINPKEIERVTNFPQFFEKML